MNRLAERLLMVQGRMQDRLLTYERRIAELEMKLEAKSLEHGEPMKAKLDKLRKDMEREREQGGAGPG